MPTVSKSPLYSQPTAQKIDNNALYALRSPPKNTRTQSPHVNPHPDNNLHLPSNVSLKQKAGFLQGAKLWSTKCCYANSRRRLSTLLLLAPNR